MKTNRGGMTFILFFLMIAGLPLWAGRAEVNVTLAPESLAAGSELLITVEAPGAIDYAYAMEKDGEMLFENAPCNHASGYYRPREPGNYVLLVTVRQETGEQETARAAFTVTGPLECRLEVGKTVATAGEALPISVLGQGGTGEYTYACSVFLGNERIAYLSGEAGAFSYAPSREGTLRLVGEIQDGQGNTAQSDPVEVSVFPGTGIGISGETGAFPMQGGYRTWIIHAPGIWRAETEDDFILLENACGAEGDSLVVGMLPGEGVARQGTVTLTCGAQKAVFSVAQRADTGEEEEVSLDETRPRLRIDGQPQCAWMNAEGIRNFVISAPGDWTAECPETAVTLTRTETGLQLDVAQNPNPQPREARVTLQCGNETGYIFLFQPPCPSECVIQNVTFSADHGVACQEPIEAEILTNRETEALSIRMSAWQEPLLFSRQEARETEEGLLWRAKLPLLGEGVQDCLIFAQNEKGRGAPYLSQITVAPQEAALACENALLTVSEEGTKITLRTTASTQRILLLDTSGETLAAYSEEDAAFIDRCIPGEPFGRCADWEIALPSGLQPAYVQVGSQRAPVVLAAAAEPAEGEHPFILYSQCDGWWQGQPYSHSNLQQSGCAIFALSHALQCLGYTDDAILPQNLAAAYGFCLREGGTVNDALVGHAGDDLGFKTRYELYHNLDEIRRKMAQGAVFSFSVVEGHIAMVAALSPDGGYFKIIDSAPSATFERIKGGSLYLEITSGAFAPVSDLSEIPGIRYYIETGVYGGAEYWLEADYVAKRGVRLIQPIADKIQ